MTETRSGTGASGTGASGGSATSNVELEQLREQIAQLQNIIRGTTNVYCIPDPIKQLSEYSGNKKELNAWLQEVEELYEEFKVKGENGAPDTLNTQYFRAIKNKLKGEARTTVCANGNPTTIQGLKRVLQEHFGDQRDFATNLNLLFHTRKGDRSHTTFYNEIKELNTKLKSNLQLHPMTAKDMLEVLTVTKFLDGIGEPLASIIRNSKPHTLEDAYQAVVINKNAEVRKPPQKQKFIPFRKPEAGDGYKRDFKNNNNYKPKHKYPHKPRGEVNHNEVETETEDEAGEEEVEVSAEEESSSDVNFQEVRAERRNT
jgi:hypothetical protein